MNLDEALQVEHLLVILLSLAVHPADNGGHVAEDGGVHQGTDEHDNDGEYLLRPRVASNISKSYGCQ